MPELFRPTINKEDHAQLFIGAADSTGAIDYAKAFAIANKTIRLVTMANVGVTSSPIDVTCLDSPGRDKMPGTLESEDMTFTVHIDATTDAKYRAWMDSGTSLIVGVKCTTVDGLKELVTLAQLATLSGWAPETGTLDGVIQGTGTLLMAGKWKHLTKTP